MLNKLNAGDSPCDEPSHHSRSRIVEQIMALHQATSQGPVYTAASITIFE